MFEKTDVTGIKRFNAAISHYGTDNTARCMGFYYGVP